MTYHDVFLHADPFAKLFVTPRMRALQRSRVAQVSAMGGSDMMRSATYRGDVFGQRSRKTVKNTHTSYMIMACMGSQGAPFTTMQKKNSDWQACRMFDLFTGRQSYAPTLSGQCCRFRPTTYTNIISSSSWPLNQKVKHDKRGSRQ